MKYILVFSVVIALITVSNLKAQNVAITDDDTYVANSSAMLDVKSTSKGMLIPRVTSSQRAAISTPATGLLVFDTTIGSFYFYNGTSWVNLTSGIQSGILGYTSPDKVYISDVTDKFGVGTTTPLGKMEVKSDVSIGVNDPIFQVINNNGDTVFAVYQQGVRVNVEDSPGKAAGSKGGFAVGGFSPSKGLVTNEFLRVTPDSVRIYIENNPAKATGSKGGFAVGGFSPSKTTATNYLDLTPDNYFIGHESGISITTGLYNSTMGYQAGKNNSEGNHNVFIGYQSGTTNIRGHRNTFLGYLTGYNNGLGGCYGCSGDNSFIGSEAGYNNTTGGYNTFVGSKSGYNNLDGSSSVYIGQQAGFSNINSSGNTYIGYISGMNGTGYANTFTGYSSGAYGSSGDYNCKYGNNSGSQGGGSYNSFFGAYSGNNNSAGNSNVALGYGAAYGRYGYSFSNNCAIGYQSAYYNSAGGNNVIMGYQAGFGTYNATSYSNNVFLGYQSGYSENTGTGNVFLGYQSGYWETGSNKLYIDNSATASPLIGGDFSTNRLGINRIPTTYTLEVGGTIWANGSTISAGSTTWSDERYKKNIVRLNNSLSNICKLRGVTYDWRYDEFKDKNFPQGKQVGVIAQEIEKVYPEIITTDADGYKSVSYEKLVPVLIEAIKEQQEIIKKHEAEINYLKTKLK